eukprot:4531715-Lingulodinium_polyedra.AAC.1
MEARTWHLEHKKSVVAKQSQAATHGGLGEARGASSSAGVSTSGWRQQQVPAQISIADAKQFLPQ